MIGSLRGRLLELFGDGEVLIEVAGVGYRVIVTPTTAVRLGAVSYTHLTLPTIYSV